MSNFEDNPSVNHKPIEIVKTQLHYINTELNQLKKDIHNLHVIQSQICNIVRRMEERRIEKDKKNKEELKKLQSGWGFF